MSYLWRIIETWADSQTFRPTESQMAGRFGVTKSAVGNWKKGAFPKPEHLRGLATAIGTSYEDVLTAALRDAGYLRAEKVSIEPLPSTGHPLTPEEALERVIAESGIGPADAAELRQRLSPHLTRSTRQGEEDSRAAQAQ